MFNTEIQLSRLDKELTLQDITLPSFNVPILLVLSGYSESGKSHFSSRLHKKFGSLKFKIYRDLSNFFEAHSPELAQLGPFEACSLFDSHREQLSEAYSFVIASYKQRLRLSSSKIATVESIKHPWILELLKKEDISLISLFITAPFEKRIVNEVKKTGLSEDTIMERVLQKDRDKEKYGLLVVKEQSDLVINNDTSLDQYDRFIDSLVARLLSSR